jgi:PhzF family phenazine biosynthesis protein
MQSIATENNLSETAFCVEEHDRYHIRWFSPLTEIDFCGHATLATAYVLFNKLPDSDSLEFYAKAVGQFTVNRGSHGFIDMSFPNYMPTFVTDVPEGLLNGLSIPPNEVYRNQQAYFAIYNSEKNVIDVEQKQTLLKKLKPYDVVVTSRSDKYDFISRYFWPANGGDEDPVTGSIHAGLAPFWSDQLGKSKLRAYQASPRGGELLCELVGDRVIVSGQAVTYLSGVITV